MIDGTEKAKISSKFAKRTARYNDFHYNNQQSEFTNTSTSNMHKKKKIGQTNSETMLTEIRPMLSFTQVFLLSIVNLLRERTHYT